MAGVDEHLVERRIKSDSVYEGHFLKVRRDEVRLPDGKPAFREYVVHPGAVMIVPFLDDGQLVVERQHRYPLDRVLVEFPAGKLDPDETTLDCARRELREETGYAASEWAYAGRMHNACAYSTEFIEVWFARGLVLGPRALDEGEFVEVHTIAEAALFALAASGELTDAKTMVGLLKLQQWRNGTWTPPWQSAD
ncbi:MAG: NUDIX hydrolase [Caulobacter sp.]|nr:NUDIX hydrolase [Vitreoscilla sp.]